MRSCQTLLALVFTAATLGGCTNPFRVAPAPDTTIKMVTGPDGGLEAVPPPCPSWWTETLGPWQNEPWPQYGCANERNLAAMVDNPEDLAKGRDMSPALGSKAATSMRRYNLEKTMPLIDPNAKAPVANSLVLSPDSEGKGGMSSDK